MTKSTRIREAGAGSLGGSGGGAIPSRDACPTDRVLAAFIDGSLPAAERPAVEAHLADCSTCMSVFADIVSMIDELPEPVPVPINRPWSWSGVAAASGWSVAAALALMVARDGPALPGAGGPSEPVRALVQEVGAERATTGRLSGGFEFGPMRARTRAGSGDSSATWGVQAFVSRLVSAGAAGSEAERRHAEGLALAWLGDHTRAIETLTLALSVESRPAQRAAIASDLSVVRFEQWKASGDGNALKAARAQAEAALAVVPTLAEAQFNLATILTALRAPEAVTAWQRYLTLDSTSPWAAEASRALGELAGTVGAR